MQWFRLFLRRALASNLTQICRRCGPPLTMMQAPSTRMVERFVRRICQGGVGGGVDDLIRA